MGLKRKHIRGKKQARSPQTLWDLGSENSERYMENNYSIFISGTESYSEIDIQGNKVSNTISQFDFFQS